MRSRNESAHEGLVEAITTSRIFGVELLYTDHEGEQPTITFFILAPRDEDGRWLCSVVRHWNLDRPDPR